MVTALTTNTINFRNYGLRNGWMEVGLITVTPGALAANTEAEYSPDSTNLPLCAVGDQIFVNPQNLDAGLVCKGARITAANTVKVMLRNVTGSSITGLVALYDYVLYKKEVPQ